MLSEIKFYDIEYEDEINNLHCLLDNLNKIREKPEDKFKVNFINL